MGLYDRDYGREYGDETPWDRQQREQQRSSQGKSVVIILLVITCVVWVIDTLTQATGSDGETKVSQLAPWLATHADTIIKPWKWLQFLTYGFMHDVQNIMHLLFNMIGLFFFGRALERKLGKKEFLRFYLVSMIFGGIVGSLGYLAMGQNSSVVGASGAVLATTVLFACYYPNSEILLAFVFPVKAWVIAAFFVLSNVGGALGVLGGAGSHTAFTVHLAGIAFAFLYYFQNWNLSFLDIGGFDQIRSNIRQRSRRAKLKIHDPDKKMAQESDDADRILAKITAEGMDSLTAAEKKTLERHSRRQRQKRDS